MHNLFAGAIREVIPQDRETPYLKAKSTEIAGLSDTPCGDNRFINNLFLGGHDLSPYDKFQNMMLAGNRFVDVGVKVIRDGDAVHLEFSHPLASGDGQDRRIVKSQDLGKTLISDLPFKLPDGSDFIIDQDYFGNSHNSNHPSAGPFAKPEEEAMRIQIWPKG